MADQVTAVDFGLTYRLTKDQDAKGHLAYEEIQHHTRQGGYVVRDFKQTSENGATTVTVLLHKEVAASGHPPKA